MFDQDFVNDGYAYAQSVQQATRCPNCGRMSNAPLSLSGTGPGVTCPAMVPIVYAGPRRPGEPRRGRCSTPVVYFIGKKQREWMEKNPR